MNRPIIKTCLGALAMVIAVAMAPVAFAETINFKASLKASEEVPPNNSKAAGTLQATYDTVTKQLLFAVNFSGLSGKATGAHFHGPADPGKNAAIVIPVPGNIVNPIRGTATLTAAQAADFVAGKWYFNIHTDANKAGEIRGQVTK